MAVKIICNNFLEGQISGVVYNIIKLKSLVDFAKDYYSCSNLPGVPLENVGSSGTAGGHWDKMFFTNEFMGPTVLPSAVISPITIKLLEGSGWYEFEDDSAENYFWGKGDGCGHFQYCPVGTEYCSLTEVGNIGCSPDYTSKGTCVRDYFMGEGACGHFSTQINGLCSLTPDEGASVFFSNEIFGAGSRCFFMKNTQNSTSLSACYKPKCNSDGSLTIKTSNFEVKCKSSGQEITIGLKNYKLIWPNINDFCRRFTEACPNDCFLAGICRDNSECFCYPDLPNNDSVSLFSYTFSLIVVMLIIILLMAIIKKIGEIILQHLKKMLKKRKLKLKIKLRLMKFLLRLITLKNIFLILFQV